MYFAMKQNKYDDPEFFRLYSAMPRSQHGLAAAGEWPTLRAMLPRLNDKRVLDLGCGYGWHCRYARQQQARSVVGIDISQKMLERAQDDTHDPAITYRCCAIEDASFAAAEFDVVFSSLALHYIEDYAGVCRKVWHALAPGGAFVFSVEHPIFSAREAQDWYYGENAVPLHWPVDHYHAEGVRHTSWLADDVVKYHRTIETYVHTLLKTGFQLTHLAEPVPTAEAIEEMPYLADELRRPIFLLLAGVKE